MLGLCKQLSNYKFLGDSIVDKRPQYWTKNKAGTNSKIAFCRKSFSELSDVIIVSEDMSEFPAHRCVLSARLEYFNSMFSHGWIETSKTQKLNLPIHSAILSVLLEYIYRDEPPASLRKSDEVEFICQVLSVADQMLGKNRSCIVI